LQITPDGFKGLAIGCINIQTLIINDFPTLTDECVIVSQIFEHIFFVLQNSTSRIHDKTIIS